MAKKTQPAPGSAYETYLLGMEENWWVRDHPFNARCVKVKRLVAEVTELEDALEKKRALLDSAVKVMNAEMANA